MTSNLTVFNRGNVPINLLSNNSELQEVTYTQGPLEATLEIDISAAQDAFVFVFYNPASES
jgi:hypothetical protein